MVQVIPFKSSNAPAALPWICESLLDELAVEDVELNHALPEPVVTELPLDTYLFREGDLKTHVYRLEAGIICVTAPRLSGPPDIIEIVWPGDLIGLGFLKRNIYNAKAVVGSRVSCWPQSAIPALVENDSFAQRRLADETEREFAYRRSALVRLTQGQPVQRLAAFLLAVSRLNEVEGRDPAIISDSLECGVVAKYLGLDLDTLSSALVELGSKGLVEQSPTGGLHLRDRVAMDRLTPEAWQLCGAS